MTCREITKLVTDYVEGALTLGDRLRFQLHIGMCRRCREYLRQMKLTAASLGRLPKPELPADVEEELLRRFDRWERARRA